MKGKWIEHLVEEPSHKDVIETHAVRVDGTLLRSTTFLLKTLKMAFSVFTQGRNLDIGDIQ
jgi:hypothetical protein